MEKKIWSGLLIAFVLVIVFSACNNSSKSYEESDDYLIIDDQTESITFTYSEEATNYVEMIVNDVGHIIIELYPDEAPITVANFQNLVSTNYYDSVEFHRIISGFMIQGGSGDSTDSIVGEFSSNGIENNISHVEGTISMARTSEMDSASSQFFICLTDTSCSHLDGDYAAFGQVIYGMDVVNQIAGVETDDSDYPLEKVIITSTKFIEIEE